MSDVQEQVEQNAETQAFKDQAQAEQQPEKEPTYKFYSKSFSITTEVADHGQTLCSVNAEEQMEVDGESRSRSISKGGLTEAEARSIIEQFLKSSL